MSKKKSGYKLVRRLEEQNRRSHAEPVIHAMKAEKPDDSDLGSVKTRKQSADKRSTPRLGMRRVNGAKQKIAAAPKAATQPSGPDDIVDLFASTAMPTLPGSKTPTTPKTPFSAGRKLKAEKIVPLANGRKIAIGSLRTMSGERFTWLRDGRRFATIEYAAWHAGGSDASRALREQGITIVSGMTDIRDAVSKLKRFARLPVVTHPGWSEWGFTLADGMMLTTQDQAEPLRTFAPFADMLDQSGSLDGWREQVAAPLASHLLASFFMMVSFAAALLRLTTRTDNFGFELAGPAGRGKSTLQALMASAAGRAFGGDGETYWRTCNVTMNALETVMAQFNDMPLSLDEGGLVQDGGKVHGRALAMRDMAFRLSAGRVKHRHGEAAAPMQRLIYVLSTNRPLSSLLGSAHAAEFEAAADRLMTIPLLADRPHGIFDCCPDGYETTGAFADALKRAAAEHYGHALPAYLQWLVEQRATDPARLQRRIADRLTRFVTACGADANSGSEKRVAEAFGLIYVAGTMAKQAGVLPEGYRCLAAARAAYDLHRRHGRVVRSFEDRLRALMRHAAMVDLAVTDPKSLSYDQAAACPVFLYTGRSKSRELLIPVQWRQHLFADWNDIRHEQDFEQRLKRQSEDRNTVERPVGPGGKKQPVYCFDITDLSE